MFANPFSASAVADVLAALGLCVAGIVGLGGIAAAAVKSPAGQRTVWQATILAIAGLSLCELAGFSPVMLHVVGLRTRPSENALVRGFAGDTLSESSASTFAEPTADGSSGIFWNATIPSPEAAVPRALSADSASPTQAFPAAASRDVSRTLEQITTESSAVNAPAPRGDSAVACWLGLVWLAGASVLAARLLMGRALLVRFAYRSHAVHDDALAWRFYLVSRRLGIRRSVRLRETGGIAAPVAWGLFRPTVVVPPGFGQDFGGDEQRAMLAHELAHLRGADPAWQGLADWLAVLIWWHPLVWWSRARLRAASEAAADEASLIVDGGPELLAACLVQLGGRVSGARPLGWVAMQGGGSGAEFRSTLGRRVSRLLELKGQLWRPSPRCLWAKVLTPLVAVLVMILCTSWARSEVSYQGEADMNMLKHYWRQSVLGAAMVLTMTAADKPATAADVIPDAAVAAFPDPAADEPAGEDPPRKEGARDKDRPDNPDRFGPREPAADEPRGREGDRPRDNLRPRGGERPPREGGRPDGADGDIPRRVQALLRAAEALEQAGLRDRAAELRREANELRRRAAPEERPRDGRDGPREGGRFERGGDFRRPGAENDRREPREMMEVIRQLQEEVSRLRRDVEQLRRELRGDRDFPPRERPDGGDRNVPKPEPKGDDFRPKDKEKAPPPKDAEPDKEERQ
jgi:hypothetical protein